MRIGICARHMKPLAGNRTRLKALQWEEHCQNMLGRRNTNLHNRIVVLPEKCRILSNYRTIEAWRNVKSLQKCMRRMYSKHMALSTVTCPFLIP